VKKNRSDERVAQFPLQPPKMPSIIGSRLGRRLDLDGHEFSGVHLDHQVDLMSPFGRA
jgi:hypothetical protein